MKDSHIMANILVHMADTKWTTMAVRAACSMAQAQGASVVLVRMLPAGNLNWLGMNADEYRFSESEREDLAAYQAIAAEHGLSLTSAVYKYDDLAEGFARAADELGADAVIAREMVNGHGLIHRSSAETEHMDHLLEAHHHHLYVVNAPACCDKDWTPSVRAVHHA
jgi:nucleotide-binding universal stress UspA family protein